MTSTFSDRRQHPVSPPPAILPPLPPSPLLDNFFSSENFPYSPTSPTSISTKLSAHSGMSTPTNATAVTTMSPVRSAISPPPTPSSPTPLSPFTAIANNQNRNSLSSRPRNKKKLGIVPPQLIRRPVPSMPVSPNSSSSNDISLWRPRTPPPVPPTVPPPYTAKYSPAAVTAPLARTISQTTTSTVPASVGKSAKLLNQLQATVKAPLIKPTSKGVDTVAIHAKFYQDKQIQYKLRLIAVSTSKFAEFIDAGFPQVLTKDEVDMVRDDDLFARSDPSYVISAPLTMRTLDPNEDLLTPASVRKFSTTSSASSGSPVPPLPSLVDEDSIGRSSYETASDHRDPDAARDMTLKITLTPASMRIDEDIIYGWQRDHIDTGTIKSVKSIVPDDDVPRQPANISISPKTSMDDDNPPAVKPYHLSGSHQESSYIPAGGLGADMSSKKVVKRVLGKFKRARAPPPAVIITSSDM